MIEGFRVMKADAIEPKDFKNLKYPLFASVKLDGIRCTVWQQYNPAVLSSSNKLIPNNYIRETLAKVVDSLIVGNGMLDGELLVGDTFQSCTSGIMSADDEPEFTYYIFDVVKQTYVEDSFDLEFCSRLANLSQIQEIIENDKIANVKVLEQELINSAEELEAFYVQTINDGHEGIIVRSCDGPYKFGRATKKQGWMLKVKPFEDAEAKITGFEEGTTNLNDAYVNEKGLQQRSAHKENKIPNSTLGKFNVKDLKTGVEFNIGTGEGLTHALRQEIWNNQEKYAGKIIKYKTQKIGTKDKPRIPIFMGFRDKEDMTDD